MQKMGPFSSFFEMADFFPPYTVPIFNGTYAQTSFQWAHQSWPAQHNLVGSLYLEDREPVYRAKSWMPWPTSWASTLQTSFLIFAGCCVTDFRLGLTALLPGIDFPHCHYSFFPASHLAVMPPSWHLAASGGQHSPSKREIFFKTCYLFPDGHSIHQIYNLIDLFSKPTQHLLL